MQVADAVPIHDVVTAIQEVAERYCCRDTGIGRLYIEVDKDGWKFFSAAERIGHLSLRASPLHTKRFRVFGTVEEVKENGIRIASDTLDAGASYWAFISEIADQRLLDRFRDHNSNVVDLRGVRVSLIPGAQRRGDRQAQSVLLSE
jgi:hypothetical protein